MVCDNIKSYDIVLANGTITQATATHHADLWRALKGGTGNFGIVTRIEANTFPSGKIWTGYAYWAAWQAPKLLAAFAEFNEPANFDKYAAGIIVALGYVQKLGISAVTANLAYTKPEKWPSVFQGFNSIWRLWTTHKIQSMTESADEFERLAPTGSRQFQVTTTVKNDLPTFHAFSQIYSDRLPSVRSVKGGVWSLIFQPLSAAVTLKGDPNVLGLETRHSNDTLVIVLVSVSWLHAKDDELVHRVSREMIALGEDVARSRGTDDAYRYLNYAASGQDPFGGYGLTNQEFMRGVGRTYDPEGFFQRAKQGGFKLDIV